MITVLVTGASGFVGKSLVKKLKQNRFTVVELNQEKGDIAKPETLENLQNLGFDHVFHLAARTYVPDSWADPSDFQRVNVMGTQNILELCRINKSRLTYVSAYLYGEPNKLPVSEVDLPKPNNPYAHSKYMAESLCEFYARCFNVHITVIRPFNIFGPGQQPHFLIPEIINQIKAGGAIQLKDLTPKRDYIYIDDLVDALMLTIKRREEFEVYNIGSGFSLNVSEIVSIIQDELAMSLPVSSLGVTRINEISDVYADISKANKLLKWCPRHGFREGIRKLLITEGLVQ